MDEKLTSIKAAIAAFFTALCAFLGWQGVMFLIWVIAMCVDWISGTVAAWLSGEWSSAVARDGAKHKGGMILVVCVAALADITLTIVCEQLPVNMTWPVLVLPLVLAWYILTELGSILENAVKMGAPIPQWLMKLLTVGLKAINNRVDTQISDTADAPAEVAAENLIAEKSVDAAVHTATKPPDHTENASE